MTVGIVGGGAAGLFLGNLIEGATLFEGRDRVGKKLLATGNGRCNLSNLDMDLAHYHGDPDFIRGVFQRASQEEVLGIFSALGLDLLTEERGRYYPRTLQASSVVNVLRKGAEERNTLLTDREICKIKKTKGGYQLEDQEGNQYFFDQVVLACGGRAMPASGSRGQGYDLARSLGLKVTDIFPGIVQVKTEDPFLKHLAGVKIDGRLDLLVDGKFQSSYQGEILITKYGLSGPPILDASRQAISSYRAGSKVDFRFSLLNGVTDFQETYDYVEEKTYQHFHKSLEDFLQGLVHKKFIHLVAKTLQVKRETPLENLDYQDLRRLWTLLSSYTMPMSGHLSYDQAQVTIGGVDTSQIKTSLEVKGHPVLYILGELLDVDGDCGGYNLQWAWSTGLSAFKAIKKDS